MATAFIFVGCQEGTLDDLKENRIINLTVQQLDQNGGGEIYFSIPDDILTKGEAAVEDFVEKLEPEDIRKLGEKERIVRYLNSVNKTKLAKQLSTTSVPVDHSELSKKLSIQEINELNTYHIETTYKETGCSGNSCANHKAIVYQCTRNNQRVSTTYMYQCINGNWSYAGISGFNNPPCSSWDTYAGNTYCNISCNRTEEFPAQEQANDLVRLVANVADNQLKDIIHHYILNKSEIDDLLDNNELVMLAYADFLEQIIQLHTLSDLNNQKIIVDAKTIETAQALVSSLSQSVKSEKLANAFSQLGNHLNAAEGKELKAALQMIDDE